MLMKFLEEMNKDCLMVSLFFFFIDLNSEVRNSRRLASPLCCKNSHASLYKLTINKDRFLTLTSSRRLVMLAKKFISNFVKKVPCLLCMVRTMLTILVIVETKV